MQNPFIVGERIYLRPLERADAPTLQPWFNDLEVTRFTTHYLPISLPKEEEFIDKGSRSETDVILGIMLRDGDRLIGATGLHGISARHRSCTLGISIGDKREWGKGYGSEAVRLLVGWAFSTANINRVALEVLTFNERARRCYERLGFQKEGILRQRHFCDGKFHDSIAMAILREEWTPQVAVGGSGPR
jgi:RimJ/RimL family protein N-acetyltransferase